MTIKISEIIKTSPQKGDMLRAVYDPDHEGVVKKAQGMEAGSPLPEAGVLGQIYFSTGDNHPYIWQE